MTTTAKKTTTKKDPLELPLKPFAFEVLHLVSKQRSKAKKVEVLKRYEDPSLKALFIWNFDETVISVLPEGEVPYTPNEAPAGTEHSVLAFESKKLWHFIKGADNSTPQHRKEQMFIQMLEGLHESEAKLLVNAKDKKLHQIYKGLSANVVRDAFGWNEDFVTEEYPSAGGLANG